MINVVPLGSFVEIRYAKGHKYLTLVYQIDLGITRLLWVGKERTIESFQGFFSVIGEEIAAKIVFVCPDMPGTPITGAGRRAVLAVFLRN